MFAIAEPAGLVEFAGAHPALTARTGAIAHLKVPALVGAIVAGADHIGHSDLLRYAAMRRLFVGVRTPSTLG